ncbi:MAG: hypothetical protein U0165_13865 [Polyangiaceae bacterium]
MTGIEVVRGPGSALYGANAFAGVINIITKKPGEGKNSVRVGAGSYGATFGSATVTQRQGDFAYRVSAGYTREPKYSREVRLRTKRLASRAKRSRYVGVELALRRDGDAPLGQGSAELTVGGGF